MASPVASCLTSAIIYPHHVLSGRPASVNRRAVALLVMRRRRHVVKSSGTHQFTGHHRLMAHWKPARGKQRAKRAWITSAILAYWLVRLSNIVAFAGPASAITAKM
ncbi:uncharacterized protein BDR25DRAFT_14644 [Lindgomyces ingoldianus]|uniref:Uncharacterized protein n=1 Tax=Lindgomyces ingoldianus TaxID=673940 RepID=A0ACB6QZW3_9PLEO|nr:uncharacterized protein BDR25DRAFT_14644 [Lindgomyces ingoldianus]KAF2472471.1 hypothetical protein BDR25DRAFT_14644 [Lindgomyces ingoldianus]